jgi:predicted NBD/HSP70 family sugar kinase
VRFVLGIDIGGTNLVVGSVAEDGSALHALASEPTGAEAGERDVLDRLIALAKREPRSSASGWALLGHWTPRAGSFY